MCAATNPFRTSDLVAKYGWKLMIYLSNLGINNLAEAQLLFVDSGSANKLDADDTEHGHSFEKPLATVDYAIGLCTASEQAIILLAPGHYEDYDDTTTGFDADKAGVVIIGLGVGSSRPRFDFNDATSKCIIGANDVQIKNVVFRPSVELVAIGLDYEASKTGVALEDVEFAMGELGNGTDEFIKAIHLTSGNHDCRFKNVRITSHASCGGATHGIHIDAASDRLVFQNVVIDGQYATGGILEDAAGKNHIVEDCSIDVSGTNYSFDGSSTFAKYTRNVDAGVDSEDAEALTDVARGIGNYPTGITDNSILAYIMGKGGTASASTFVNTTDSLEAIRDAVDAIDTSTNLGTAVPADPTARSLQDILEKDTSSNFDRADDSLEAISDALLAGTGCTAAIDADSLDKLVGTSDTDQAYPASLVSHSILSSIMSATGVPTTYDRATDSLEAISVAINALSWDTAVSQTPTARSLQDILEKNDTGSFDDSTDSLEAIADRLIDSDIDKLTSAADGGSQVYPDSVVQESVIAYILSKSANPINTSYNNTTDSLEALRDRMDALAVADQTDIDAILVDTGTTIPGTITTMQGNVTDILLDTATTIPGTITTLQTDATAILADTDMISGATLPASPTAGSLARYIASGGTSLGQPLPTDMSLIDIIGNFTGAYNATDPDDNIKAALDHLSKYVVDGTGDWASGTVLPDNKSIYDVLGAYTADSGGDDEDTIMAHLDLIYGDTAIIETKANMGRQTLKVAGTILTGGDVNIFTIGTGPVKITSLFFIMTAATDQNCKAGFSCTPTAGAETDLTLTDGAGVELNAATDAGDIVYSEMDATVMVIANTDGGAMPKVPEYSQIVPIGAINLALENNAPTTGAADIYIQWEPLAPGATLTAT